MYASTEAQVVDLLQYLDTHTVTYVEVEAYLAHRWARPCGGRYLLDIARNRFGDDIVVTDWGYWPPRYRTAASAAEGLRYINRRVLTIRNSAVNQTNLLNRVASKFPTEEAATVASNRANMLGAINLLDGVHI